MAERTVVAPADTAPAVARAVVSAGQARMLYIDNMRVGLITLVIVGHMAITYGAPVGDWYYHEPGEMITVLAVLTMLLLGIGAAFLLGLFYMISGYFTPGPYDRKGPGPFLADRLKRLGLPLVVYAVFINPLVKSLDTIKRPFHKYGFQHHLIPLSLVKIFRRVGIVKGNSIINTRHVGSDPLRTAPYKPVGIGQKVQRSVKHLQFPDITGRK